MGRSIGAVVIGVIAGLVAVIVGDAIARAIAGIDPSDREALKALAASPPTRALVAVFLGWVTAAFVGPLAGAKVAAQRQMMHAMIVGGMLLAATVGNLASIPHPIWMWVGALVVFPVGAFLAGRLVQPSESFTRA